MTLFARLFTRPRPRETYPGSAPSSIAAAGERPVMLSERQVRRLRDMANLLERKNFKKNAEELRAIVEAWEDAAPAFDPVTGEIRGAA